MTLNELNALEPEAFVSMLSGIFEHSPWVARAVVSERPFASQNDVHRAMCAAMRAAPREQQLELIRAHPELAARAHMTLDSVQEQSGAGLDRLTAEEFAAFQTLNAAYRTKFGFPFILAVRGKDKTQIRQALERRIRHEPRVEFETCLNEIEQIASFRLHALLEQSLSITPPGN